ncbi:helix-turn-helix domain-containing protein [Streptomyces sp. MS1.AVA.3]|uniref:helix-turn-helix domain-containing protein n=1 Tax=Streptomyces decoyicus TaxID=249567 RepID=UPI0030BE83D2
MLTTRTHEQTQPSKPQHLYRVLATLASLGRGPHSLQTLTRHTGLDRQTVREHLAAMVEAGLCTASAALPGHYELAMRVVGTESTWLLHALPTVEAHTHDQLRTLHQATGQVVLLHSHTLLPPGFIHE